MTANILTPGGRGLIARAHDQRRDHCHRPPPPHYRGMGGRLRLRLSPLPPDTIRGFFLNRSAI
jgi:hypothetical protein